MGLAALIPLEACCYVSKGLVRYRMVADDLVTQFWNGGSASYGPADSWTIHGKLYSLGKLESLY